MYQIRRVDGEVRYSTSIGNQGRQTQKDDLKKELLKIKVYKQQMPERT